MSEAKTTLFQFTSGNWYPKALMEKEEDLIGKLHGKVMLRKMF